MAKIKVAKVNDVQEGKGKVLFINGKEIALFKLNGEFFAMDNTCPHQGGSLGDGSVNGDIVTCPLHGWEFNVKTSTCLLLEHIKLDSYKVEVSGEDVFIDV